MAAPHESVDLRRAWPAITSCALAVVALVAFFSTTELHVEFSYAGKDNTSVGVNFSSSMDWWFHISVITSLVVGAALGAVGGRPGRPLRALGWVGFVVDALSAIVLGTFILIAISQARVTG